MRFENKRLPAFGLVFILFFSLQVVGQAGSSDAAGPLGDVVKNSKKPSASKAKVVVTDDNLKSERGPIPDISLDGVDNSDEIAKAIQEFRKTHSPTETEDEVRAWYDEWDKALMRAIGDNATLVVRKEDRNLSRATVTRSCDEDPPDYCRETERRNSEIRQDRDDYDSYHRTDYTLEEFSRPWSRCATAFRPPISDTVGSRSAMLTASEVSRAASTSLRPADAE